MGSGSAGRKRVRPKLKFPHVGRRFKKRLLSASEASKSKRIRTGKATTAEKHASVKKVTRLAEKKGTRDLRLGNGAYLQFIQPATVGKYLRKKSTLDRTMRAFGVFDDKESSGPFPNVCKARLIWDYEASAWVLDPQVRLTDLYDPLVNTGGDQPDGYDTLTTLYNYYCVRKAKIEAWITNEGPEGDPIRVWCYPIDIEHTNDSKTKEIVEATSVDTWAEAREHPNVQMAILEGKPSDGSNNDRFGDTKKFTYTLMPADWIPEFIDDDAAHLAIGYNGQSGHRKTVGGYFVRKFGSSHASLTGGGNRDIDFIIKNEGAAVTAQQAQIRVRFRITYDIYAFGLKQNINDESAD
jgi:hypothetical protein